jgi:hypothetical protein
MAYARYNREDEKAAGLWKAIPSVPTENRFRFFLRANLTLIR